MLQILPKDRDWLQQNREQESKEQWSQRHQGLKARSEQLRQQKFEEEGSLKQQEQIIRTVQERQNEYGTKFAKAKPRQVRHAQIQARKICKVIQVRVNSDPSYEYASEHSIQIGSMDNLFFHISLQIIGDWSILELVIQVSMLDWKNIAIK